MFCNPEAKFIIWLAGVGGDSRFIVVNGVYRLLFIVLNSEAASQVRCMKTMLR